VFTLQHPVKDASYLGPELRFCERPQSKPCDHGKIDAIDMEAGNLFWGPW